MISLIGSTTAGRSQGEMYASFGLYRPQSGRLRTPDGNDSGCEQDKERD